MAATGSRISDEQFIGRVRGALSGQAGSGGATAGSGRLRTWRARLPWGVAAAATIVALVATAAAVRPRSDYVIARITEMNGSLLWIGDGGRVDRDLNVGKLLSGGTFEALTADSWAALELRDEKIVTFIGLSAHGYFDKALELIAPGGFDQCMLSYGYLPRGHNQVYSARMVALRHACLAKAHEFGMGIAAMKVVGAGVLGAWSKYVVPGFDKACLGQLPGAAIRYVLNDDRIQELVIGMRLKSEIDANIRTLTGDLTYAPADRALLAGYSARSFESDAIKKLRIEP